MQAKVCMAWKRPLVANSSQECLFFLESACVHKYTYDQHLACQARSQLSVSWSIGVLLSSSFVVWPSEGEIRHNGTMFTAILSHPLPFTAIRALQLSQCRFQRRWHCLLCLVDVPVVTVTFAGRLHWGVYCQRKLGCGGWGVLPSYFGFWSLDRQEDPFLAPPTNQPHWWGD